MDYEILMIPDTHSHPRFSILVTSMENLGYKFISCQLVCILRNIVFKN